LPLVALLVAAQAIAASAQTAPPPSELAPAIRAALAGPGARVAIGDATIEFWWVKSIAGAAPGSGWSGVESGTLVGAVQVTGAFKEVRGKSVKPGVYTLRFGLQPQNGDHLGISPNREFLLLSPAAADPDAKVLGFDGVVAIAKQTTGTSHPASLSLDPPEASEAALSTLKTEMGHTAVVFEAAGLKFGLIVMGTIVH
jgi:hypothetical protein